MTHPQIAFWTSAAEAFGHAVGTQVSSGQILGSAASEGAGWDEARAGMATALSSEDSLGGSFVHPGLGELSRLQLLVIATNDVLIHSWDLAQALGVDTALPVQNLQPAIDGINAFPVAPRKVLFAEPLEVAEEASPQERLLAVAGRRP